MIRKISALIVLFIAIAGFFVGQLKHSENMAGSKLIPEPKDTTQIVMKTHEDEEKEHLLKMQYFENMHKAAPNVDWREIEKQSKLLLKSKAQFKTNSSFANGELDAYWQEKGSNNQSGRVHTAFLDVSNNKLYCGSAGGNVWKGNPDGTNWQSLNDDLQFDNILSLHKLQISGGERLFVPTGGKLFYYSDDDGVTWQTSNGIDNVQSWGSIQKAIFTNDVSKSIYLLVQEWDYTNWNQITSIYKSVDKAATFSLIQSYDEPTYGNHNHFDIFSPVLNNDTCYIIENNNFLKIDPANSIISSVGSIPNSPSKVLLAGTKVGNTSTFYIYSDQNIYRSTNSGATWSLRGNVGENPFRRTSFNCSINNPDNVFFGSVEVQKSTNGGQNWSVVNNWWEYYGSESNKLHADIPSIISTFDGTGNEIQYISTDGGLYKSTNQLSTVQNLSLSGLRVDRYYSVYTNKNDTNYIYVGTQDQGFLRTGVDNGGILDFDQVISGDYGHIVSADGGNSLWTVYPGFAHFYANAKTGTASASWNFNGANELWIPPLMADLDHSNIVYMAGGNLSTSGSHIIKLTYSGGSISAIQMNYDFDVDTSGSYITSLAMSPINHNYWYILTDNGQFFYSTNAGQSWTQTNSFTGPGAHYFYGATIHPSTTNLGTVTIGGSGYSNPPVYQSTDNGASFTDISSGMPSCLVYKLVGNDDEKYIFAATSIGAFVYSDSSNSWYDISTGFAPDQTYWTADYIPSMNTVRFGTYGRGLWDFKMPYKSTSKSQTALNKLKFNIFPNPASEFVTIDFSEVQSEIVKIELLNTAGKQIYTNYIKPKLNYVKIPVDNFPSGVYFVRVSTDKKSSFKKLIVK